MSDPLNHEQRLERLESHVAAVNKGGIVSLEFIPLQQEFNVIVLSAASALKNDTVAISCYPVESSAGIDEKTKREFLTRIARAETECEALEMLIAKMKNQSIDPPPVEIIPPITTRAGRGNMAGVFY